LPVGCHTDFLYRFYLDFSCSHLQLLYDVHVVSLDALYIVLYLAPDAQLADSHVKNVLQESLELGVLSEWAVHAVFVFYGQFETSLSDHDAIGWNFF